MINLFHFGEHWSCIWFQCLQVIEHICDVDLASLLTIPPLNWFHSWSGTTFTVIWFTLKNIRCNGVTSTLVHVFVLTHIKRSKRFSNPHSTTAFVALSTISPQKLLLPQIPRRVWDSSHTPPNLYSIFVILWYSTTLFRDEFLSSRHFSC